MKPPPHAFRPRERRPAIVGHRGVRGSAPENTLAAIREAHRQGADAVEVDVRPCASGEVVVIHDPDLERVAGDRRRVSEMSRAELLRADVGEGERVPTLEDVLALSRDLGLGVNVEIKHDTPDQLAAARAVARVLARWDRGHDVIVSSFAPLVLAAHRVLVPWLCHAQLVHESTYHDWALRLARAARFDGVHTEGSITVPARVGWHARHGFVNTWTVNTPAGAQRAFAAGARAIITDEPAALRAGFAR